MNGVMLYKEKDIQTYIQELFCHLYERIGIRIATTKTRGNCEMFHEHNIRCLVQSIFCEATFQKVFLANLCQSQLPFTHSFRAKMNLISVDGATDILSHQISQCQQELTKTNVNRKQNYYSECFRQQGIWLASVVSTNSL